MAGFAFASSRGSSIDPRPTDQRATGRTAGDQRSIVERMAAGAPHRGEATIRSSRNGVATAAALDERRGSVGAGIATDAAGRLIVADTRLDERDALGRRLGLDPTGADDATLILAAFARWGDGCADELRGDFAFVIWDPTQGEVFAARDLFGMRPLFYAATPGRLLAASEVAQILGSGELERRVDERSVLAALTGRTQSPAWTLFAGVRRLRPGHILRADRERVRTRPFWRPPRRAEDRLPSGEAYAAELKAVVDTSVRDRLIAVERPGLLLSGGIDSTSVAATAAELRARDPALPALTTYSFGYDGFPGADERSVSGPLTQLTGQANVVIAAGDAFPLAEVAGAPDLDGPEFLQSHALMRRTFERARADGVDLVMTGHRGDSLFGDGIFDYLGVLRSRGVGATWGQIRRQAAREGTGPRAVVMRDLVRRVPAAVWPRSRARRLRGRLRDLAPGGVTRPPWIRAEAIAAHGLDPAPADAVPISTLAGDARRRRHEAVLLPSQTASTEYLERLCAQAGIRYADPWSDRRLADWVLAVPPHRVTVDGTDKWVQREAMRGTVPDFARDGRLGAHPTSFYQFGILEGAESTIRALLEAPVTADRGWVDAAELRAAYERYRTGAWPGLLEWNAFWRWATLEQWLRVHGGE